MVTPARTPLRPDRLRALNLPSSVEVSLDTWGRPTWVRESTGGEEAGGGGQRVEDVVDEWRIDDEWWRTPIHRRYVEVVREGGAHVVLFEAVMTGEWSLQKP